MKKPIADYEFVLKANDKSFERVYLPYITVDALRTFVEYKYPYNYDISIVFKLNSSTGELIEGYVFHDIKGWRFDIDNATEIRGFEGNKPEFDFLKEKSVTVIRDNVNLIKESLSKGKIIECEGDEYYDSSTIEEKFREVLK